MAADRNRIHIVLIGQHLLVAEALAFVLGTDPALRVVGIHAGDDVVVEQVTEVAPDVVLVDDSRGQTDAASLTASVRDVSPEPRIVVLTDALDETTLSLYARAGAVGCLPKDCAVADLIQSVKQVHNGQILFTAENLADLLAPPPDPKRAQILAPREIEVLQILASGMSTPAAAATLGISVHTLRTHLKRAMTKLGARSKLEAVIVALREGLIELRG